MRYDIAYDGPDTRVAPSEDGFFRSFLAARAAAIEYLTELIAGCEQTLASLQRASTFEEYEWANPAEPLEFTSGAPADNPVSKDGRAADNW